MAEPDDAVPAANGAAPAADDPGTRGTLTVRGRAASRIVERAALDVPGVLRHTTRRGAALTGRELPRAVVDMMPTHPNVRVDIALSWPSPVAALCRRVRERIIADLGRYTGRVPSRVDIEVAELVVARPEPVETPGATP